MKWNRESQTPRFGELRTKRVFLWKPKTICGETRWLCTAGIVQEYYPRAHACHPRTPPTAARAVGYMLPGWVDLAWEGAPLPETRTSKHNKNAHRLLAAGVGLRPCDMPIKFEGE